MKYEQIIFPTKQEGDVEQLQVDHLKEDEHRIYKTLALTGNKTGPLVGVLPIDEHLSYKNLQKHLVIKSWHDSAKNWSKQPDTNTVQIPHRYYETKHFPIYISDIAQNRVKLLFLQEKLVARSKLTQTI